MKIALRLFAGLLLLLSSHFVLAADVDINSADAATLAAVMSGVGERRAEAIVAYREQHGPFASVDELVQVSGIGPRIVEDNRDKLRVGQH